MDIKLGFIPLASGNYQATQEFSDGTIRMSFAVGNKNATIIMSREEAEQISEDLNLTLRPPEEG